MGHYSATMDAWYGTRRSAETVTDSSASNALRFASGAAAYDAHRPRPPEALVRLALSYAGADSGATVVDLGAGTGLSTRVWCGAAARIIGVEPSAEMRAIAEARGGAGVEYRAGDGSNTGLDDSSVQVVSMVQALHWMEPASTFAEVARILVPGGVLAVADTRFPPAIHPEIDAAFQAYLITAFRYAIPAPGERWDKAEHEARMLGSGYFSSVRTVALHNVVHGDAEAFIAFARTAVALRDDADDELTGLAQLADVARRRIGSGADWVFGYRGLLGAVR